jgi:uncharacterized protein (TIGR03437 family)
LSLAPAAWAANLTSVTLPNPVYVGNPFTVTITSTSNDEFPITFSVPFSVPNCTCTVVPSMATYAAGSQSETFTVTIFSLAQVTNAVFRVTYGNQHIDSSAFDLIFATPQQLHVQLSQSTAPVGQLFNVTVTAQDNAGHLAYGFNGDAAITATLSGMPESLGTLHLTNGTGSGSFSLGAVGTWTITASSGALTTPSPANITITAPPAVTLVVSAPSTVKAGDPFAVTVEAHDASGNRATGYSQTVTLTSNDPQVPSLGTVNVTAGIATLMNVHLETAGTWGIFATDGTLTGSTTINVTPGDPTQLAVTGPLQEQAGTPFIVKITAQDVFRNTVTTYNQTVTLTSTDSKATGMGNVSLTSGSASITTIHETAGLQTITATSGTISGHADVIITAASVNHFLLGPSPASAVAGTAFQFTVTPKDRFGNTTSYSGTIQFTSSDNQAVLPAPAIESGMGPFLFSATLRTAGSQSITASDSANPMISGGMTVSVSATTLDHFLVSGPPSERATAGTAFDVTATAKDVYGNTVTSYTGPATPTSSDGQAVIPFTVTFTSGIAHFQAILKTQGLQTITVADQADPTKKGTAQITVDAAAAMKIVISGTPPSVTAGTQFMFTVAAQDSSGNVVASYGGTLHFTSSDANAINPPNSTLTSGIGTFQATLRTAGSQTLTATDTVNATIAGTSMAIVVNPGPLNHFVIQVPGTPVTVGAQFPFIVTAQDQFNNTITNYTGPVTITSTDPRFQIVQPPSFVNGVATGNAILRTSGGQTLTVTDPVTMVSTTSSVIQVVPGPPASIQIVSGNSTGPLPNNSPVPINTAFAHPLVVSVIDQYGNPIPGEAVTFSAPGTGASAVLSGSTVQTESNGQASVNATANQFAGTYAVMATIVSVSPTSPATPQVQFGLTNLAGTATTIKATGGISQATQIGTPFPQALVATVTDSQGNPVPSVTVTFSAPAQPGPSAALTPPGPYTTDSSGKVTVTATANQLAGTYNVTASISVNGTTASDAFSLTNTAGLPSTLTITGGSGQSTAINSPFTAPLAVLVKDASGNPVPGATVAFVVPTTGASANLSAATAVTDASGMASVTAAANAMVGSYTAAASVSGGGSGTFALTNTPGAAAAIVATPGTTPQSTQTNTLFSQPLRVRVTDASGNGVPNVSVAFQAPQTGASASLSAPSANTDAQGYASVTAFANGLAGSYFVFATAAGVSSQVSFSLQNLAQPPARIIVSGGASQSAVVSQKFPQALQVTVFDAQNNPLPNVPVTFTPPATGSSATLSALSAVTNAQGQASVSATANTVAGTYQVEAAAEGISTSTTALFSLTNLPGTAAAITAAISGTPQSARVNTVFLAPLLINVTDTYGNPVPGAAVAYSAPASGPSALLSAGSNVTNAQGQASVTAIANAVAGSYAVTASLAGAGSAPFNLTNTPGPPASIEIVSGNHQTMTVGGTFAPLVVVVLDAVGNRVPGQTVTFAAPQSGASAAAAIGVLTTDSTGQASFNVAANNIAGRYAVAISGSGIAAPALFALINTAAAAARILVASGSPQTAVSGTPFQPLRVLVDDAFGNAVSGVLVNFSAPGSGATALLSTSAVTDSTGQASIGAVAGSATGSYVVTASAAGVTGTASFSLTNTSPSSGAIIASGGTTQSATVATAFAIPLIAIVHDLAGNPVPGVTVTFTVPPSGPSASLPANTAVTDSHGTVSLRAVANSLTGSYQVVAAASGFSGSAVFNLQNTPAVAGQPTINAIVNAASFLGGAAPRSLQTIFGSNLATTIAMATTTALPLTLGGVTVTIGSTSAPLLYVSPTQINFQAPTELSTGQVVVTVSPSPTSTASAPLALDAVAPGIFLQIQGDITRAAAVNTDGTNNTPSTSAPAGGYIQMFLTGIGSVSPPIPTGQLAPLTPLSVAQGLVSATIGSRNATVQFAGAHPLSVIDQVNLQIPVDLPPGDYPVVISVNGVRSNAAVISVGPALQK